MNSKGTEERKEIAVREFELLCARFRATFGNAQLFHALYPSSVGSTKSEEDIGGFDANRIPFSSRGKLLLNETPFYATSLSLKILHEPLGLKIRNLFVATIYFTITSYVLTIISLTLININFNNIKNN